MSGFSIPPGYVSLSAPGVEGAALAALEDPLREALAEKTFYDFAQHHPQALPLTGRGIAYAVPLSNGDRVVVRRSRHGGLLGALQDERFVGATRAPRELELSLALRRLGVPTPEIVAYATYPAGPMFRRADVVSRKIPHSRDLASALGALTLGAPKRTLLDATARLLAALSMAGARHPDLNIKNVLIASGDSAVPEAYVLDVDRVWLDVPGAPAVLQANLRRLTRSALKWRRLHALPIEEADLLALEATAREIIRHSR